MLESGHVKWFDTREGKRFGFIQPIAGGKELWFHYSSYRPFVPSEDIMTTDGDEVIFADMAKRVPAFPRQGEVVYFSRGRNAKGEIAHPWGYKREHDRVLDEIYSTPNYGNTFTYVTLNDYHTGHYDAFRHYGTIRGLTGVLRNLMYKYDGRPLDLSWKDRMTPEDRAEYDAVLEEHKRCRGLARNLGYGDGGNITQVIPSPGQEKNIGRMFKYFSSKHGLRVIAILEIPKEHVYTGLLHREFVESERKLDRQQVQERLKAGLPVYHFGGFGRLWNRVIYREKGNTIEFSLQPLNSWGWDEDVKPIRFRYHCTAPDKDDGDYASLPDFTRDEIAEVVGIELANRMLTENFLDTVSVEQIIAANRKSSGGGVPLEKILELAKA